MTDRLDDPLDEPIDEPIDASIDAVPHPTGRSSSADVERGHREAAAEPAYVRARWHGVDADSGERVDLAELRDTSALTEGDRADRPADDLSATNSDRAPWWERTRRRVFRRPIDWLNRPWPTERVVAFLLTVVTLAATTMIMMSVVHFNPLSPARDLVFDDTTPTGGDFGAHVWGPAYLRDHLLPAGWFNGWSMDWYAGMPTYRFYMVLPAFMILLVDLVLPYGVAMKVISIVGLVTLPACCWAFGRLAKFRYPMPELFAVAGVCFALDESFSIYGGNLRSTMAGEFSFSISLSLAVLGLGLLAAGLRTGKYRVWAAVLIAAACVAHGIVLIFTAGAALVFSLVWVDRKRIVYAVTVGVTALLLMAWWVGPFLGNHAFMTDMKYGGEPGQGSFTSWWGMYFPLTTPLDVLITTLAIIGFAACIVRRHLNGVALGLTGVALAIGVWLAKESLPVIGLLWNPRLLPFFYLVRYMLMMVGAVEILTLFWNMIRDRRARDDAGYVANTAFAVTTSLVAFAVLGFMFQSLFVFGKNVTDESGKTAYEAGLFLPGNLPDLTFRASETNVKAAGNGWARYNFLGYEGRNEYYTEYHQVVTTMADLGDDPAHGCGRAMWENHADNGKYGTTMALMLLPFWTDGCIGSMEGLYFEASGTTPYHFLTAAAMSKNSSNPVRELRYTNNNAEVGVPHLQDLGVRYVMLRSTEAQQQADTRPELTMIAESYPWKIYQVAGSDVVVPLATQPVVVNERGGDQRERHLELGTSWFQNKDEWAALPADDGPAAWQRIDVVVDDTRREVNGDGEKNRVDVVVPGQAIEPVALPEVQVSQVDIGDQSLSFDVDRTGVPVLVRVSYFPNWKVSGAEGPFRVAPNMMVVVPTSNSVELTYGRNTIDYVTALLTLLGIALCVFWRFRGDLRFDGEVPAPLWGRAPAAPPVPADADDPFAGTALADVEVDLAEPDPWWAPGTGSRASGDGGGEGDGPREPAAR